MRGPSAPSSSPRTAREEDPIAATSDMAGGRIGLRPSCSAQPTGSRRRGRHSHECAGSASDSRVSARTSPHGRNDEFVTCDESGLDNTRTEMGGVGGGCACARESSRASRVWRWASRRQVQNVLLMTCFYLLLVAAGAAAQGEYQSVVQVLCRFHGLGGTRKQVLCRFPDREDARGHVFCRLSSLGDTRIRVLCRFPGLEDRRIQVFVSLSRSLKIRANCQLSSSKS